MTEKITTWDGRGSAREVADANHVHSPEGACLKRRSGERCPDTSAPSAEDREALRTAVWETQDGYSTTLRADQTERVLSAIEPGHRPVGCAMSGERLRAWWWIVRHPIRSWRIRRWVRAQWDNLDVTR